MWRFCASLPLFPSLCTLGLRVNDPCLPTSKGHGPMACIVHPPFGHFYMVISSQYTALYLHICQYVLIFILKMLSLEVPTKTQGYSSVSPKNASASRLLSVSHILSLHYFIALAYSRHIGAFFSYETCKHLERFFF